MIKSTHKVNLHRSTTQHGNNATHTLFVFYSYNECPMLDHEHDLCKQQHPHELDRREQLEHGKSTVSANDPFLKQSHHKGRYTHTSFFTSTCSDQRIKEKGCIFPNGISGEANTLAQRLGKMLALAAPSSGDGPGPVNEESFKLRMRQLQSALEKRRTTKTAESTKLSATTASTPNTSSRRALLINTVGAQRAHQIISLVREIRVLRLRRRDLLNNIHAPMLCTRGGGCSANVYTLATSADNRLSREVRDLFFCTAIVDALEKTPVDSFDKLPWDHLYLQGVQHVKAYRSWLAANGKP
jgi:hypothetical protein